MISLCYKGNDTTLQLKVHGKEPKEEYIILTPKRILTVEVTFTLNYHDMAQKFIADEKIVPNSKSQTALFFQKRLPQLASRISCSYFHLH